jgi:hypothetical protein
MRMMRLLQGGRVKRFYYREMFGNAMSYSICMPFFRGFHKVAEVQG